MLELNEVEKENLRKKHRKCRYSQMKSDRIKAILMMNKGYSYQEIEEVLLIDSTTLYRWRKNFESDRNIERYLTIESHDYEGKLTKSQIAEVISYVESNLIRSVKIVSHYIKENFKVSMQRSGVNAMLKRLGFSYKATTGVYSKANLKEHEDFKNKYEELEKNLSSDQVLLCADAMHVSHNNKTSRAWIRTGKRAYIPTNSGRSNLNLHGVYNPHAKETFVKSYKVINQENIISFFKEVEDRYPDKKDIFVVMDNARYYKGSVVQEYFKTSRIRPWFLPVGAPNLNLIERFWKQVIVHSIRHVFSAKFSDFKQSVLSFCNQSDEKFKHMLSQSVGTALHLLPPQAYAL